MIDKRQLLALAAALVLGTSMVAAQEAPRPEQIRVLATFSILGDLVRNVGGDRVDLVTLVGPNGDAHVYAPSPADAKRVADARLIVANGLGFEGWMGRLIKAANSKAPLIEASKGVVKRVEKDEHGHAKHDKHDHDHGGVDPHAWQSVGNVKLYVANIRDALIAADPAGAAAYKANAEAYLARLDALDAEIRAAVAAIPPERRRIVTTHDAFGYFKAAYGIDFVAPQGVSTEAQPSARDIGRLISQIKKQKIPAVFLENVTDPRLLTRIAQESGARIGGTLYSDSLTDKDGPAPTYIDLIRHNVRTLSTALSS